MFSPDQIEEMLNDIPLFAGCSQETLAAIAKIAVEREFKKGETIYETGDEALNMFVLVKGLVNFRTAKGVGHLHVDTLMKRHMIFGWAALVPEHPRRLGSASCMDDSTILSINGDAVMEILEGDTRAGFLIMKRLCSMIASTFIEKD